MTGMTDAHADLTRRARRVRDMGIFLGGPAKDFAGVGRSHLDALVREGLEPRSNLLDFGCGVLRSGYWFIDFLEPGNYCGIEPDERMLEAGIEHIVGRDKIDEKQPRFSHDANFDLTVFGESFDFVTARSIWTHTSKSQMATMLDGFAEVARPGGKMIVSYLPAVPFGGPSGRTGRWALFSRDYRGDRWIGHSHEQKAGGLVAHSPRWIKQACAERGLKARHLRHSIRNMQIWLLITRASDAPERH